MNVETGKCLEEPGEGEGEEEGEECPSYLPFRCRDLDASCRATKEDCPTIVSCQDSHPFFSK